MEKAKKTEIMKEFGRKDGDSGSPEVQVALMTARIVELTDHMRSHKKDHSTRRGLMTLVNKRKRLLKYLGRENHGKYVEISEKLGLRGHK